MEITAKELEELYRNNTNIEVCRILGISSPTLISLLKDGNIERKGKGGGFTGGEKKIKVVM